MSGDLDHSNLSAMRTMAQYVSMATPLHDRILLGLFFVYILAVALLDVDSKLGAFIEQYFFPYASRALGDSPDPYSLMGATIINALLSCAFFVYLSHHFGQRGYKARITNPHQRMRWFEPGSRVAQMVAAVYFIYLFTAIVYDFPASLASATSATFGRQGGSSGMDLLLDLLANALLLLGPAVLLLFSFAMGWRSSQRRLASRT